MFLGELSAEAIASGIAGILLAGALIKRAWDGYAEARKTMQERKTNPMVQAMASVWDEAQRERFMVLMERLVESQEAQAKSLADLTNRQQEEMREQIQYLVTKLGEKDVRESRKRPAPKNRS